MSNPKLKKMFAEIEQKIIFGPELDDELRWPDEEIWQKKP